MTSGEYVIITDHDFEGNKPAIIDRNSCQYLPNRIYDKCLTADIVLYYNHLITNFQIIKNIHANDLELNNDDIINMSLFTKLKMFWFSRWLSTNYEGYLNTSAGSWYIHQMKYFNDNVFKTL